MNAERLLQHYERIADAPDAIARLRRFILDLAVRGKLVPQDPNDEPASELMRRITKEKARLVKAGETRDRKGGDLDISMVPFELPLNWIWIPFGDVHQLVRGVTYSKSDVSEVPSAGFIPVLRANNIGNTLTHEEPVYVKERCVSTEQFLRSGDFMIALSSGSKNLVGKAAFVPQNYREAFGGFCGVIRLLDQSLQGIVRVYLQSNLYRESIAKGSRGIGINNLKKETISNLFFPLPPSAEQHRIVGKVDELMGLCDRLEAARAGREETRDRLTAASLARLNAPDPETFREDARFALDALPALTTRPDQIKRLRQTILNLAVRGKLVPQDANDEPASELLKRIAKEKAELVKRKQIRREDALDLVLRAEVPFDVPASWVWSRIGEAVLFTQYGTSQKSNHSEKGVPVLTMGNIQDGLVIWSNEKRIPESSDDLPALYLRRFDLLYNRTNSAELVGKTGIYLGEDSVRTFASYLIRLRPSLLSSNPHFVNMAMNTPEFRETQIVPLIKKQTGQANVNGTALKNMLIPIPPLAEQHRIVAKVDALMALCDRLEASLAATADTRRRLLDALLAGALADAVEMEAVE